jgi:hypothetical protein
MNCWKAMFAATPRRCPLWVALFVTLTASALAYQGTPISRLHVSGRYLQNPAGTNILLHGYMMAGDSWFNGEGHLFSNLSNFASPANCAGMLNAYNGIADILSNPNLLYGSNHGWCCSFVRTAGNGTPSGFAPGWDTNGVLSAPAQFHGWITNVMVPWVNHCKTAGLYAVICGGPSQTYPGGDTSKNMTQQFQANLITYWTNLANAFRSSDNVIFEICNEPINIETGFGANNWAISGSAYFSALTNFMQPIVNAIRRTGDDHILLIPSLGWQGQCQGFANYPVLGTNIAYAGHFYPGYNNIHDNGAAVTNFWNSNYKPCADKYPLVITELVWTPNNGTGYQDLWNGSTAGFGLAIKGCIDQQANVSYLVGFVADLLTNLTSGSLANATLNSNMQSTPAAFHWFAQYAGVPPAIPSELFAAVVSSNQIRLTWNAVSKALSYNVRRSTVCGGPYTTIATNVTGTTYSDSGLSAATTYYYVVSAVNGMESGNSTPVNATTGSNLRFRIVVISDFPPTNVCLSSAGCPAYQTSDPDDVQSMVRFLLYANEFEVEGLVASSGTFANVANKTNIFDMLTLYDLVYTNLSERDVRYPTSGALRAVTFQGRDGTWGNSVTNNIGAGKDSEASEAIISIVDQLDPRPVWFSIWGDCSSIAQAVWKVQNTRSAGELQTFLSKMRLYQIAHQDDTIDWLLASFPSLFIIYSGNTYFGMFGSDDLAWLNTNIRSNHGPLGAIYPPQAMAGPGVIEGDTPSYLHLVSALRGINNPENPAQGGWGGKFALASGSTNHWVDCCGGTTISTWKNQYETEFAQRADWMLPPTNPTSNATIPVIQADHTSLATPCPPGQNAPALLLSVSNAGTGSLNYTITNGASWLAVTPTSGSSSTDAVKHTVGFISSNLPPGAYLSSLLINAPAATPSLASVPVAVRVFNSGVSNHLWNTPLIDLNFNEGSGTSIANQGVAGGNFVRSTPIPLWTNNVPPAVGGGASVDFQTNTGSYYVESPTNYPQLIGLSQFTICGWVNCRSSKTGSGGNRLVTWINGGGDGVDVVYRNDGSVQLGINQWPDGTAAISSSGMITTDANAGSANWRFFAVTYDSTLSSNHVAFYFGSSASAAAVDVARTYARGLTGTNISRLCIGQFDLASRGYGTDRMFRGLIDEVQVFGQALSLDQIQVLQTCGTAAKAELHLDALTPQWLLLSWMGANVTLQAATNLTGPWPAAASQSGAQFLGPTNAQQFFRLHGY